MSIGIISGGWAELLLFSHDEYCCIGPLVNIVVMALSLREELILTNIVVMPLILRKKPLNEYNRGLAWYRGLARFRKKNIGKTKKTKKTVGV